MARDRSGKVEQPNRSIMHQMQSIPSRGSGPLLSRTPNTTTITSHEELRETVGACAVKTCLLTCLTDAVGPGDVALNVAKTIRCHGCKSVECWEPVVLLVCEHSCQDSQVSDVRRGDQVQTTWSR